jgi:hypothetical protein
VTKLPRDLFYHLIQWTDASSSLAMGRVCRSWYCALLSENAWKRVRSDVPQSIVSSSNAPLLMSGSLASDGPSFELVWRRDEMLLQEAHDIWFDTILAMPDHPSWSRQSRTTPKK